MIPIIREINAEMLSPEAYAIYSTCMYRPTPEKYAAVVGEYRANPETRCYGSFEGSRLSGLIVVRSGEILGIAVRDTARGQGAGRSLIGHAQKLYPILSAETDEDSVGFYRACGFVCEAFERAFPDGAALRYRCTLRQ